MAIVVAAALVGLGSVGSAPAAHASTPPYTYGATVATGYVAQSLAVNPTTHLVYALSNEVYALNSVENQGATTSPLSVIDENTESVVATVAVSVRSGPIAIDSSLNLIYVGTSDGLQIVDGATNALVGTIATPGLISFAVNSSTHAIYVVTAAGLQVVNGVTRAVTATVALSNPGNNVVVDDTTGTVYVGEIAAARFGFVEVINGSTNTITADVAVGSGAADMALDEPRHRLYVATWNPCTDVIDTTTNTRTGCGPFAYVQNFGAVSEQQIAVSESTGTVFIGTNSDEIFSAEPGATTATYLGGGPVQGMVVDQSNGKLFTFSQSQSDNLASVHTIWNQPLPTPPTTSTPVYRFWSPTLQVHFYTISDKEKGQIIASYPASVWTYEGVAYQAFPVQQAGTIPLYRFWSPTLHDHFYTASRDERDSIVRYYSTSVWSYEGIAYYVLPLTTTLMPSVSVARFWSPDLKNHFYTADAGERDYVIATYPSHIWMFEDNEFSVPKTSP